MMFMRKNKALLIGSALCVALGSWLLLNSFKKASLSPVEFRSWVKDADNGLWVSKTIDNYKLSLLYKPVEYMVINENKNEQLTAALMEKGIKEYGNMQYYTLRIESQEGGELLKVGITDESQYAQRLEYFMSAMQDDISLADGADTLACILYHFERDYGMSPHAQFVLGFEGTTKKRQEQNKDKELIVNDRILGLGAVHLLIQGKNIDKIPAIKL